MDAGVLAYRQAVRAEREAKKVREAQLLRGRPPEQTVRQTFELMAFMRLVAEAADHADSPQA
jgi:hypothetical protein